MQVSIKRCEVFKKYQSNELFTGNLFVDNSFYALIRTTILFRKEESD